MLITILDGNGVPQKIIAKGQEAIIDHSGSISDSLTSQTILPANVLRSGFLFQNIGVNKMAINFGSAASFSSNSFVVEPGQYFPPADNHNIISSADINIVGTAFDRYVAKEW